MKTRIILMFFAVVGLIVLTGCDSSKPKPSGEPVESLTVGATPPEDMSSLIWVAKAQGFFSERGLNVNIKSYESGVATTKDLVAGKLDLATAMDFVMARHILDGADIRMVCSICEVSGEGVHLAARRDRRITQSSDLRHKRIGLVRGSIADFMLDLSLAVENIPLHEVEKIDLRPSDQVKAISEGNIDAVILWEPFLSKISHELGANFFSCPVQNVQNHYLLLLGMKEGIGKKAHAVHNFVASLIKAEELINKDRHESRQIVARELGTNHKETTWNLNRFVVGLEPSLMILMEAELRWMSPDLQANASRMPDISKFIYFDALESVKPEKIKIRKNR